MFRVATLPTKAVGDRLLCWRNRLNRRDLDGTSLRSRLGKPNQRKGQNEKLMNVALFCEFLCFSLGKQARFTLNFCSGMPLRTVHELPFLWFGLPGPEKRDLHLVALSCAMPRDYLSNSNAPLLHAMRLWGFWYLWCDTPSPFSELFPLGEHAKWRCDTPLSQGYLSDACAIPYENETIDARPALRYDLEKLLRDMGGCPSFPWFPWFPLIQHSAPLFAVVVFWFSLFCESHLVAKHRLGKP